MTPLKALKGAVTALERAGCAYCLAGGHAASLYRIQERVTRDVDFAIVVKPPASARAVAEAVISDMGLTPVVGYIPAGPKKPRRKAISLVTSKPEQGQSKGIIDLLLPVLPWIEQAVERAQHNRIDLGFSRVPVITPEDLIIAKCYALRNSPDRFQDLDDLKEIFSNLKDLDSDYLQSELSKHELEIPEVIRKYASVL